MIWDCPVNTLSGVMNRSPPPSRRPHGLLQIDRLRDALLLSSGLKQFGREGDETSSLLLSWAAPLSATPVGFYHALAWHGSAPMDGR